MHLFSRQIKSKNVYLQVMRRLLWMIFLFGAYMWLMTSGHDRMLFDQGKNIYQAIVAWLDDAEVDYQMQKHPKAKEKAKKRSRRWD